ncbi:DUF5818 domain-containing protein [Sphingosinithalassobacter sp. CS137]|uniref:DUF5818 domain-containing protein n=1 Tax=Sphingosinithalassobacter sp. CS137 TaxID=2762748 RepID=UPI00165E6ADB|nr:DUF5818 domain-containing protein [Sphingosinithalassobacter sp. CS137]
MTTNRRRITGRLELGPRGYSIVTEAGDHWVLEGCEPDSDTIGGQVTAEGESHSLDRLRTDWIGTASA